MESAVCRGSHSLALQDVFVGVDLQVIPASSNTTDGLQDVVWCSATSDGFAVLHTRSGSVKDPDLSVTGSGVKDVVHSIVENLRAFARSQAYKIQLVAFAAPLPACFLEQPPRLLPLLWRKLDTIPFLIDLSFPEDLDADNGVLPSAAHRRHIPLTFLPTSDERSHADNRAQRVVKEAIENLSPGVKSATPVDSDGQTQQVEVDRDGQVFIASLEDYESTTSPKLWEKLLELSSHLKRKRVSIAFFSATPQGGGVALMRSALVRLWKLLGVNVKWYVPEGHPAIFDITKRKMHNVLQGVNEPGVKLEDHDKIMFESWTKENLKTFWSDGALDSSVIIIDDPQRPSSSLTPQISALIPHIQDRSPKTKIIFRSHIQIDTSLVDDPAAGNGVHAAVWEYLWQFIKQADLFVAHPVKRFVPRNVLESRLPVLFMAPSTDPLDGLNKPIGAEDLAFYQQYFRRLSIQQCGTRIDWHRPYIVQVARFDPSKGIPALLRAYLSFRQQLSSLTKKLGLEEIPQLIICGHGSIDDPDGQPIFETIKEELESKPWEDIKQDVATVRVPPCDRTLGAILQGAWCATQLSTKEGFEVKVTECVHKRVPIVATRAGGIPLQVKHGVNAWLVEPGDAEAVAAHLLELFLAPICPLTGVGARERQHSTPSPHADDLVSSLSASPSRIDLDGSPEAGGTSEDFWTVGNAVKWMVLFGRLTGGAKGQGEGAGGELEQLLGGEGGFEGMEGRDVWEVVNGRDDELVIE